jgi:hypothetical protein
VIHAAGHWYTSGTLWAVLAVVASLVVGVPTFLVTWAPRQRLLYGAAPATRLLTTGTSLDNLEIRHRGRPLANPHLLDVTLTNRGRRDIPSSAFDQGRPLVFDVGAAILEVLQVRCDPMSALTPPTRHYGNALMIGPELISRSETITISLLVDGDHPGLTCTMPVLAQVTLTPRTPATSTEPASWPTVAAVATAAAGWAAVAAMALATDWVAATVVVAAVAATIAAAAASVAAVAAGLETKWRPERWSAWSRGRS